MRFSGFQRRAGEVRRAVLPGRHSVHHFRPGNRVSLPLGGGAGGHRHGRVLVDDDLPRRPYGRVHLRMEERRSRMGVIDPKRMAQAEATARQLGETVQDKGFLLTKLDDLLAWARTGSMWPMTFGLACC